MAVTKRVADRAVSVLGSAVRGSEKMLERVDARLSERVREVEEHIYHAEREFALDKNTVRGVPGVRQQRALVDREIELRRLNRSRKRVKFGMRMVEDAERIMRSAGRKVATLGRSPAKSVKEDVEGTNYEPGHA